ncbi:DENN domain protein [Rhodotorula toruloides]|uniref:DENN domain protein n=1 Tax=Rhodotorula toruloides TaxID=5286 RepID=A0A511K8V9_RHOTO|nr:DENN domain protein [Rhodotorula toruloides]
MATPISELYARPHSAYLEASPFGTPPYTTPPGSAISSLRASRSTYRTTVSLGVDDDPFAAGTMAHDEEERGAEGGRNGISQDSTTWLPPRSDGPLRRTSSFFRSLVNSTRPKPRRTRSSIALSNSAISSPLPLDPPPKVAPVRARASLVQVGVLAQMMEEQAGAGWSAMGTSYPSGSTSLRGAANLTPERAHVEDEPVAADETSTPASPSKDNDVVGVALTTDAPSRRASQNRRSLVSSVSTPQLRSRIASSTSQGLVDSSTTSSPQSPFRRVAHADSPPPRPPPSVPLPPIPQIKTIAPTPGTTPASHKTTTGLRRRDTAPSVFQPSSYKAPPGLAVEKPEPPSPLRADGRTSFRSATSNGPVPPRTQRSPLRPTPSRFASPLPSASNAPHRPNTLAPPVSSAKLSGSNSLPLRQRLSKLPSEEQRETEEKVPLASLYLVAGLSKDPQTWVRARNDEGGAAEAGEKKWKPEVLGVLTGGEGKGDSDVKLVRLDRAEREKVTQKALKMCFRHDVEIVSSPTHPPATTSFFSFVTMGSSNVPQKQYHAVALKVWSQVDPARAAAIVSRLRRGGSAGAEAVKQAKRTTKLGRRLSQQLIEQIQGFEDSDGIEVPSSGFATETDGRDSASDGFADKHSGESLWMPYSIILVSTVPIHTLLSDVLRLSWALYHQDLAMHNAQMDVLLNSSAPRPGERIVVPISLEEEHKETSFVVTMPGEIDWATGSLHQLHLPIWPVFKTLHLDNMLTIAELALAPSGKIAFISRHDLLLDLSIYVFQQVLEGQGWKGLVQASAHVRDLPVYLDDSGPWLIGVPYSARNLLANLAPDVIVVDLDNNLVTCSEPPAGTLSKSPARDKLLRALEAAVGNVGRNFVPREVVEAFSHGRFQPFSLVEVAGHPREAERLVPDPAWQWSDARALSAFSTTLSQTPRDGIIGRVLRFKSPRKTVSLDHQTLRMQLLLRKNVEACVEQRDSLESDYGRANRKLAVLIQQSLEWQESFAIFKEFSERAALQVVELRDRLAAEYDTTAQLSGQLVQDRERRLRLEASLEAAEQARLDAITELSRISAIRRCVEEQRALLSQEVRAVISGAEDETSPIYQAVAARIDSISHRSQTPSLSPRSHEHLGPSVDAQDASSSRRSDTPDLAADQERVLLMQAATQEVFRVISSRLSLALQAVGGSTTIEPPTQSSTVASSVGTPSPSRSAVSDDATLVSTSVPRRPSSPDIGPFSKPSPSSSSSSPVLSFQPKPLHLTPPVTPEVSDPSTPFSFVTMRPRHRRIASGYSSHGRQNSLGAASVLSSTSSDASTPLATPLSRSFTSPTLDCSTPPFHRATLSRSASSPLPMHEESDAEDDAQSFVSVSEGNTALHASRAHTPASMRTNDHFELEELADNVAETPERRDGLAHTRQSSWSIDAPPVALFTRSGSIRSVNKRWSINTEGRVRSAVEHIEQSSRP